MSILLSSAPQRKRLVVLGLDGLPLFFAKKLGSVLPNIGRIAKDATTVRAELPELSPVNWTSFFTGQGPEVHGIYGFSRMHPGYQLGITDRTHIECPTIFDKLGDAGIVSRVINLPNTYPAPTIRGMIVSGFVSRDLKRAAYPPFLAEKLAEANYKLEADTTTAATDLPFLLKELRETLKSRRIALDLLWPDLSWDLFIHVFTETDRLFHFAMDAVLDESLKHHFECIRLLAELDHAVGDVLDRYERLPGPKRLMVLADHGFTELKTEVCINTWLKKNGFLSLSAPPSNEWDASVITNQSTAFALDPGRIYIHTRNFERGQVPEQDKPGIMNAIRTGLMELTYNGEQIMEAIHIGKELYPGGTSDQLPDLVCQTKPGIDLKAKFDRNNVFGFHGRTGSHTVDGAIFYDSEGSQPARMRDTGRTILNYFNIPSS